MNEKTRQVQFRLTPDLHRKLKSSLDLEDKRLVSFFNDAAKAYLKDSKQYKKMIEKILGE